MTLKTTLSWGVRSLSLGAVLAGLVVVPGIADAKGKPKSFYTQTNLVSDIPGKAKVTDPNLVNPWGISRSATSPWWVSDNGTGVSTLYGGDGTALPLVVTVPPVGGAKTSAPTGQIFNGTGEFVVSSGGKSGSALFIFATEDGSISGWNPTVDGTHSVIEVDKSRSHAIYKGLAIGSTKAGNFLYAANFHSGRIDVFNSSYRPASLRGSFADKHLPRRYAPFGIQNINGKLYVTYAQQDSDKHDDVAGRGRGFVDVFNTNGKLVKRLVSRGRLNAPWGLAWAPNDFGKFDNDLLVGNFGDGRINAYNPRNGEFEGALAAKNGRAIAIQGLWALGFGNGANAGPASSLFFTAGIADEQHGLFGTITSSKS